MSQPVRRGVLGFGVCRFAADCPTPRFTVHCADCADCADCSACYPARAAGDLDSKNGDIVTNLLMTLNRTW
jgi:hypothetical protein